MAFAEKNKVLELYNKANYVTIAVALLGLGAGVVTANPALINASALGLAADIGAGYAVNTWAKDRAKKKGTGSVSSSGTIFSR